MGYKANDLNLLIVSLSAYYKQAINKYSNLIGLLATFMLPQHTASFQELMPVSNLDKQLKSNSWNARKQTYDQILYLLQESDLQQAKHKLLQIGGKQYTVKQLIPFFEDIVDEEHPGVLLTALQCVETMIEKGMCSGREFLKLTDQGFDKFPLKISKGKEIMQKFADIIEKIELDPYFLTKKLNNSAHQKCIIFTLEVVSMLGMTQLYSKVREISQKHPKSAVREVAAQICSELEQVANSEQAQEVQKSTEIPTQKVKIQTTNKTNKVKSVKKLNSQINSSEPTFSRSQLEILEKVPQFEQLKSSKDQQNHSEGLLELFKKYFQSIRSGKSMLPLPQNQLTNLSHLLRVMVESNNAIISTNGLKIIKILIENNCPLIPRSFPLLFVLQKFRLHATHQINHLLYQICDSFLLCNPISTNRNTDLIQAVSQGAYNKKANVVYGSFMVFLRTVAILYGNEQLFSNSFPVEGLPDGESTLLQPILSKINEGNVEKIKSKLYKLLMKCLQNFTQKVGEDKKYDDKLQDIKITMSLWSESNGNAVSSIDNLKSKTLKKTNSQVSSQPITNESKTKIDVFKNPSGEAENEKKSLQGKTTRSQNKQFKIINPEQKMMKILNLCSSSNGIGALKKLVGQSILELEECMQEQRFQLFYYSEVMDNFMNRYCPSDETSEIISEYLLQFLLKISKAKFKNTKLLKEGLRNLLKLCFCSLVLGSTHLNQILTNFAEHLGLNYTISGLLMLDQSKTPIRIKKKNRKTILTWLDANVPAQYLTDHLFGLMDKIEKGQMLGLIHKQEKKITIDWPAKPEPDLKLHKKITFNSGQHKYEQKIPNHAFSNNKDKKVITNDKVEYNLSKKQVIPKHAELVRADVRKIEWNMKKQAEPEINFNHSANPPFQSSHISQISSRSDHSAHGLPSIQKDLEDSVLNLQQQMENGAEVNIDSKDDDEASRKYMNYYAEYKKQKNKDQSQDQIQPHFRVVHNSVDAENNAVDSEGQKEQSQYAKLQNYRQYIAKIRQNYLPAEYLKDDGAKQNIKQQSNRKQLEYKFAPREEVLVKRELKNQAQVDINHPEEENKVEEFQYKLLNANKVSYMLQNAANPYSHLRNELILPFKKSDQQQYFLKQINLFITSLEKINQPQPYNSLLLLVILLFSEIHTNRVLITPLQELYEHLASLVSTNQFLKIIISLFHSVIEQTSPHLRTFLITILTKSVARLMPFCEDSLELLRDLSQFYNVGQNVYFEMYESEYAQICNVIEGQALYEVVQRALSQEKQNLAVIVESWFETKLKGKIKQYICTIMEENEEQMEEEN